MRGEIWILDDKKKGFMHDPAKHDLSQFVAIQSNHSTIDFLCDALESVADSLPTNVDRAVCHQLAEELTLSLKKAQELEELYIFPALCKTAHDPISVTKIVKLLESEHFEDLCFAEEVTEMLHTLAKGNAVNMEAVGYMLRSLFCALRRHMSFEYAFIENQKRN